MEGYHLKGPDTSEGLTPPNCSYITRCKELIKTEHANWIGLTNQDAIAGVLSELEKKDIEIEVLKRQVDVDNIILEKQNKELETYKKIAEKLAELLLKGNEVPYICDLIIVEHCNKYKSGECGKCIIDWARKEVKNEVNKARHKNT